MWMLWILTKKIRQNILKSLFITDLYVVIWNLLVGLFEVRNKKTVGDNWNPRLSQWDKKISEVPIL